ncbi:hypothetical protein SFRURICE_021365 [Spodoptera frugiperda]|nr:hypothetical protein SFRURICE_021365 [Spodoptera frugiperda]
MMKSDCTLYNGITCHNKHLCLPVWECRMGRLDQSDYSVILRSQRNRRETTLTFLAVSTSAKLCVPMNMIGGSQTHSQQHSIVHLLW